MTFYEQYLATKEQYPNHIIFVRVGEFYETFGEDAKTVNEALSLILCSRLLGTGEAKERVWMAGVPFFTIKGYIADLVEQDYRVALADQMKEKEK